MKNINIISRPLTHLALGTLLVSSSFVIVVACGDTSDAPGSAGSGGTSDGGSGSGGANSGGTGSGSSGNLGGSGGGSGGTPDGAEGGLGGMGGQVSGPACSPPDAPNAGGMGGTSSGELAITGSYDDGFGTVTIDGAAWDTGYSLHYFTTIDSDAGFAVALNAAANDYFPCDYSRFVWVEDGDSLYYCQSPYAAETEEEALLAPMPNTASLEDGCDGFPWSELTAL